ncbi:MAG: peptidylprolyl isomerase [Deferribacterales bacterium]
MRKIILPLMIVFVSAVCFAGAPSERELAVFTAQKYKTDYFKQTQKSKEDIAREYSMISALAPGLIETGLKDDPDYKVASNTIAFEIWAKKYTDGLNITDDVLKKIYDSKEFKLDAAYNIRNILVKDSKSADKIIAAVSAVKNPAKRMAKFAELAQSESDDFITRNRGGSAGWMDISKMEPSFQEILKNKKAGDLLKQQAGDRGWQVVYLEDFRPARKATFEEVRSVLVNVVKQAELSKKIQSLLSK